MSFTLHLLDWREGESRLRAVRESVFIQEQQVPEELEWDGLDAACRHLLALNAQGEAIGCARITPDAQIGRMCVLPQWRRQRVGAGMLQLLLTDARARRLPEVHLHAQLHALPFYRNFGFVEYGETFMDAGIPHLAMRLLLS
ncbi:MAG: GNAT family N-acetyltransferase [Nitrosomonadales bacterium]|nr:GNAT family N-acetyltransferase [Nitrosomonadales bacterium]